MLNELAQTMPVDSQSRSCYQRLAAMLMPIVWTLNIGIDMTLRTSRHAKDTRQSIADLPHAETNRSSSSSNSVHSLRKEAWLLLQPDRKTEISEFIRRKSPFRHFSLARIDFENECLLAQRRALEAVIQVDCICVRVQLC